MKYQTGACLIIGDEVLSGKIRDLNSNTFTKLCFEIGIDVRHIAVVPDESEDIKEAIKRLSSRYDFIVTSGGIGPTHDDITYQSIADAYGLPLDIHQETVDRMQRLSKAKLENPEAQKAHMRMALLPTGNNVDYIYVSHDLWVPIVTIDRKVHILPGIPQLFQLLLNGLKPELLKHVDESNTRYFVSTAHTESSFAHYLTRLQNEVQGLGIKIGSYPHYNEKTATISIIGPKSAQKKLRDIVSDVSTQLNGHEVSAEEEAKAT